MTEELKQKAEEYASENDICVCGEEYWSHKDLVEAYIAGAIENGIVWHDLRKDPKDLPKDDRFVVVSNGKDWTKAFYENNKWNIISLVGFTKIIKWAEIPQFKE